MLVFYNVQYKPLNLLQYLLNHYQFSHIYDDKWDVEKEFVGDHLHINPDAGDVYQDVEQNANVELIIDKLL